MRAALLDLIAALAVRETPVIEDLAAFAEVLVALGDDRLAPLDGCEALFHLFHRRLVRWSADVRASATSVAAYWLASARLWLTSGAGVRPAYPRRALNIATAPTAARTTAMTIRTTAMIMSGEGLQGMVRR